MAADLRSVIVIPPRGVPAALTDEPWRSLARGIHSRDGSAHIVILGSRHEDAKAPPKSTVVISFGQLGRTHPRLKSRVDWSALIILEPRETSPRLHSRFAARSFSRLYAASPIWARELGAIRIDWPWPRLDCARTSTLDDFRHDFTIVAANKRSASKGSLYSLRRQLVKQSIERGIDLKVIGAGWDGGVTPALSLGGKAILRSVAAGSLPSLREALSDITLRADQVQGFVSSKCEALMSGRSSLVIENADSYVSEKFFDCLAAGVVPVYAGPSLTEFGIPEECVVRLSVKDTDPWRTLMETEESVYLSALQAGQNWFNNEVQERFDSRTVFYRLGENIASEYLDALR